MALLKDITSTHWTFDINNPGKLVQGIANIKQCVGIILNTEPGSDPLRPDFGCGAHLYIDKPVSFAAPRMIKAISEALAKWEPRIENVQVQHLLNVSHMTFRISYTVKDTKITDQLNQTYGGTT